MRWPLCLVLPKRIPNPAQMTSTCQSELEVTPNPVLHFRPCIASVESPARKVRQVNIILRPLFTLRGPNNTTLNHNRCLPSCVRNQMASLKRKRNDLEESEDEGPSFNPLLPPVNDYTPSHPALPTLEWRTAYRSHFCNFRKVINFLCSNEMKFTHQNFSEFRSTNNTCWVYTRRSQPQNNAR